MTPAHSDLSEFATTVQAAIATLPADHAGRFGRKVFVAAVHAVLGGDLAGVKSQLFAAHRAGLLSLARADLVAAMDPAAVASSEIAVAGATYHFVVDAQAVDPWAA